MKKKTRKETGNYIFPNIMAEAMKRITPRIQYESSMMSLSLILISLLGVGIYTIIFTEFSLGVKIITGINTLCMFVFLSSNLVTTYQQYVNYMQVMEFIEDTNPLNTSFDLSGPDSLPPNIPQISNEIDSPTTDIFDEPNQNNQNIVHTEND